MTIPASTSTLPGMAVDGTFSPSIRNANAPANSGIRSEIVAVTTDGKRSEAKANAKLGIAVQSIARPRKISTLDMLNAPVEVVVRNTHQIAVRTTLPKTRHQSDRCNGNGELRVKGDLTIHGVTKEVILDVERPSAEEKDPYGNTRIGASATTKIKRSEFGLTWNAPLETGGILVGDDLKINLEVSLIKA